MVIHRLFVDELIIRRIKMKSVAVVVGANTLFKYDCAHTHTHDSFNVATI